MRGRSGGAAADVNESDVVSSDGATVRIFALGAGKPLLLLHPGSSTWMAWRQVARRLSPRFLVLAFDRRPYRADAGMLAPATMTAEVADVVAVARSAAEPVLLIGHSSRAVVALEAALAVSSLFAGLVLYEPPVAVSKALGGRALVRARAALDSGDPGRAMEIHMLEIVRAPRYLVTLLKTVRPLWRLMVGFANGQITDDEEIESLGIGLNRYSAIEVPVLLLGGARSPAHLRERLNALAHVLPRLDSVVILRGQGHVATAFAPDKVARVIEAFADRVFVG